MYALITGASSGIGFEFAEQIKDDYHLIILSQNKKRLSEAATKLKKNNSNEVITLCLNLQESSSIKKVADFLKKKKISVDLLINNAGIGFFGSFAQMSLEEAEGLIELNIKSLTSLTHLILPGMIEKKSGKIINVASTAAFQPIPYFSVYAASKSYVLYFSEALAREVEDAGVKVMALCPGATKTSFFNRATKKAKLNQSSGLFNLKSFMTSKEVVSLALKKINKNPGTLITGTSNFLLASSARIFPRSWVSKISKLLLTKSLEK